MCECRLLIERATGKPIQIGDRPHDFIYTSGGKSHILLDDFLMQGVINYAACHRIEDAYGVKQGYLFVIGERDPATVTPPKPFGDGYYE